jgi:MFS family permease
MIQVAQCSKLYRLMVLASAVWGASYARYALNPLQETLRASLTLTDNQVALIQGPAIALPTLLCSLPLGILVDRYSRTRLLAAFATLELAAFALTAVASSVAVLFLFRLVVGVAIAGSFLAAYSLLADEYAPEVRGRATIAMSFAEIVAAPAALAVGALALAHAGSADGSWRAALLWMSLLLVPLIGLTLLLREPPRTGVVEVTPRLRDVIQELYRYRALLIPLIVGRGFLWLAGGATVIWAAPSMSRQFHISNLEASSLVGSALLVSGILAPLIGGPIADFCQRSGGPKRTMWVMASVCIASVPFGVFCYIVNSKVAGLMLTVFLTLGFTLNLVALTVGSIIVPGEMRGIYLALTVTGSAIFFDGLGPLTVSAAAGMAGSIGTSLSFVGVVTTALAAVKRSDA